MTNFSNYYLNKTQIVKEPIITDKATRLLEKNQYSFRVKKDSNKTAIKLAIEYLFDVKVKKVNTCRLARKKKRVGKYVGYKPQYKKAVITLVEGDKINLFSEN